MEVGVYSLKMFYVYKWSLVSKRIDLFCRNLGNISGLFGLKVVTYGIKLLSLLIDAFGSSKSGLLKSLSLEILSSMRDGG